jgi:hypothetical protein
MRCRMGSWSSTRLRRRIEVRPSQWKQPWEDYLLERKVESDLKDLLKTLVVGANAPGHPLATASGSVRRQPLDQV